MDKQPGKLIVISAPSGCGKTTLVARLLARHKDWKRSISYTTRLPRPGEANGRDYFFVSTEEFQKKERHGFFLESAIVFGCSYGTSKEFVLGETRNGSHVDLAIDVQGAKQLTERLGQTISMVSVFILPPSLDALKARLQNRKTETDAEIEKRLTIARQEMAAKDQYDIQVINDEVEKAVQEIEVKLRWQFQSKNS